ncbi:hypothetical protein [Pseudomonas sp. Marseille-Q5115]|uniref:hypothetical protein n=1 Tax=Pseudomonas sp. Marseille-Q5115 TaxID=2866593 RepID=UPI001CE3DA20|nr:hypothetical protein [Pseudomonas sp. Marseille-Q5115]
MFAKLTKALLLSTCLVAAGVAGTASADERNFIVPVVAGAAVGALIASNWDNGGHHHHDGPRYAPPPRQVVYVPAPQPVYYRPAPQVVYYRPAPPPPRHWEHHRFDGPRW